jgi:hypothetical protein
MESCGGLSIWQFVDEWCFNEPLGAYGMGLWKNIERNCGKLSSYTRFELEDGSKVRFWHDRWCGDKALKEAFPNLYGIICAKDAVVAAPLELSGGSNKLNVSFVECLMIER